MSRHRNRLPAVVDRNGVEHRPGCTCPGWVSSPATSLRGVYVNRCSACGAVRIVKAGEAR